MTSQRGMGLLELLLVIAIMAVSAVTMARYYQQYARQKKIETMKASVLVLKDIAERYNASHCQSNDCHWKKVSIKEMIDAGDVNKGEAVMLQNPFSKPECFGNVGTKKCYPVIEITRYSRRGHPTQLRICASASLLSRGQLNTYARRLGAKCEIEAGDPYLTWTWVPGFRTARIDSPLWIQREQLVEFNHVVEALHRV